MSRQKLLETILSSPKWSQISLWHFCTVVRCSLPQEICGSYVINYDQMWQTSICRLGNSERTDFCGNYTSQGHTWIMTISQNPSRSPLVGLLPFVSPIPWQKYMKIIFFSKVHLEYRMLLSLQVISLKIILMPLKLISPKVFWRLPELNCEDAGRFSKPSEDYRRSSGKEFRRLPKASKDYSESPKILFKDFLNVKLQRFAKKNILISNHLFKDLLICKCGWLVSKKRVNENNISLQNLWYCMIIMSFSPAGNRALWYCKYQNISLNGYKERLYSRLSWGNLKLILIIVYLSCWFLYKLTKFVSHSPLNCLNFLFTRSLALPFAARTFPEASRKKTK